MKYQDALTTEDEKGEGGFLLNTSNMVGLLIGSLVSVLLTKVVNG